MCVAKTTVSMIQASYGWMSVSLALFLVLARGTPSHRDTSLSFSKSLSEEMTT